jgi:hypothetical protein
MVPSDDVRRAMLETNRRFCHDVVGQGNFDEIDRVYTADAQILPPGAPLIKGRKPSRDSGKRELPHWESGEQS